MEELDSTLTWLLIRSGGSLDCSKPKPGDQIFLNRDRLLSATCWPPKIFVQPKYLTGQRRRRRQHTSTATMAAAAGGLRTYRLGLSTPNSWLLSHLFNSPTSRRLAVTCSTLTPTHIPKKTMKKKVLVISGPTGAGKSRLAMELANRLNGEIISADSVQVVAGQSKNIFFSFFKFSAFCGFFDSGLPSLWLKMVTCAFKMQKLWIWALDFLLSSLCSMDFCAVSDEVCKFCWC